jgi:hypothetical protein
MPPSAGTRQAFAHEAVLTMAEGADISGPGGAVTAELCGSWDHEPPCPLAAHWTGATRAGTSVRVRVLFATEPEQEALVRRRIDRALAAERVTTPDGSTIEWHLQSSGWSPLAPDELEHARRLEAS